MSWLNRAVLQFTPLSDILIRTSFFYPSAKREKDKNTPMHTAWNKKKAAEWIESFFTVTGHAYCVYVH